MAESSLIIDNLHKEFDLGGGTSLSVLKGINLEMKPKDFFALMGASGSGKSTLLNIIGALVTTTSGKVTINGQDISTLNDGDLTEIRRHNVGWIFQNFALIDNLTALENVMIPLNLAGKTGPEAEQRATELLERVGLGERIDHFPDGLSGGQKQRVAIARALANDPPIILADEPTGNLDTRTGKEIIELFKSLTQENKIILMVSHDVDLAHASDKVFILKNGIIYEEIGEEVI
ncbi:MAG: ABC transporter ATP-binding protein [Candidatus Kariarchaeaceae archaeon]|jgi:putative ABC transport system ATP-binding protein